MVLKRNNNPESIFQDCATVIFDAITELRRAQHSIVIGLPGGRSITGVYKIFRDAKFDWTNVHFFLVDERMVPLDHADSNFKLIMESFGNALIQQGKIPKTYFHPFIVDAGVSAYNKQFAPFGSFDIIILGTGEDGHCASLFPNHHSILDEREEFFTLDDSPKMPPQRMTASRKLLIKSKVACTLFLNESKREALEKFLNNNVQMKQLPIKLVNSIPKHFEFTDLQEH